MARKKKNELPSGNIRVEVYDYTDNDGKKHYKSFTAPTKAQAQALATEWKNHRRELKESLTVAQACERYIEMKRNVLSPYTITGYETALRRIKRYSISGTDLTVIKNEDLQRFISELSLTITPKSIRNTIGLISASLSVFLPRFDLNVTLPAKVKPKLYIPTAADVQALLNHCNTTELKLAILFAAIGTMRRGEACAVTFSDVNYETQTIEVNKSMAKIGNSPEWVVKAPKTYSSYRRILMPKYVMDLIKSLDDGKHDTVLNLTPDQVYDRFSAALRRSGLPAFRYHDLRHYAASKMHADGIPQRYIEAMGGWKPGSDVLKRVYENVYEDELLKIGETFAEKNTFSV